MQRLACVVFCPGKSGRFEVVTTAYGRDPEMDRRIGVEIATAKHCIVRSGVDSKLDQLFSWHTFAKV